MSNVRVNTLRIVFAKRPLAMEIHEWIDTVLTVTEDQIEAIQLDGHQNCLILKLVSSGPCEAILRRTNGQSTLVTVDQERINVTIEQAFDNLKLRRVQHQLAVLVNNGFVATGRDIAVEFNVFNRKPTFSRGRSVEAGAKVSAHKVARGRARRESGWLLPHPRRLLGAHPAHDTHNYLALLLVPSCETLVEPRVSRGWSWQQASLDSPLYTRDIIVCLLVPAIKAVKHSLTLLHPAYYWLTVKRGVSKQLFSNQNSRRKEQVFLESAWSPNEFSKYSWEQNTVRTMKVFHVCAFTDDGLIMKSFLCPESTLFDQTILKCNWWFYVDCKASARLYDSNIPVSKSYQLMKALAFFSSYNKS
ncbi:hypothetical protein PR048_009217 [Dryococelus australis]|uniref:Uncharacterized protein n=1 Tax=Dryococelus australis TaxID=614101 RepID=A0ABQ9I006_9NEOP|nr:hypothetical protein PR048_009217 [Dryococelus australis]